ncbi:MAG: DUF3015 domain-containing protein [Gammaproteobacteria bacterium]|nr:DUF3015 domain-containing protein [Gammaproteobacteria bacterium]
MKKLIGGIVLLSASSMAMATAPGGPDCGWGNMIFDGQSGIGPHFLASITNGTSGNATFGMTSGTNGCSVDGSLSYGGESMISSIMDEFSSDVARGHGEALNAVAVMMGVEATDRSAFSKVTHENFTTIFPHANVTAKEVITALNDVMKSDARLAKYSA